VGCREVSGIDRYAKHPREYLCTRRFCLVENSQQLPVWNGHSSFTGYWVFVSLLNPLGAYLKLFVSRVLIAYSFTSELVQQMWSVFIAYKSPLFKSWLKRILLLEHIFKNALLHCGVLSFSLHFWLAVRRMRCDEIFSGVRGNIHSSLNVLCLIT
jgi:hypothetical protein